MSLRNITGGLYLVVDPSPGAADVLPKVEQALSGGVDVIQVWNHWAPDQDKAEFILKISAMAHRFDVPVLINEEWQWLDKSTLDGVHFDDVPPDFHAIKTQIKRSFQWGLTCGNDETKIQWAIDQRADYLSFCSVYPSSSASVCDLVDRATIIRTRKKTKLPIFAAGGINLANAATLCELGINGFAIISGVLKASDPQAAAAAFKHILTHHHEKIIARQAGLSF